MVRNRFRNFILTNEHGHHIQIKISIVSEGFILIFNFFYKIKTYITDIQNIHVYIDKINQYLF